jgi:putative two-component system response regulator
MRALIIDDSVVIQQKLEDALRNAVPEVDEVLHAANGLEGLAVLERIAAQGESIDLILCDIHMPAMDGLGFLRERPKRNLAPGVPIVMITADAGDPYLLKAIVAGAVGYIAKPFSVKQMRTRLTASLACAVR